ncbi:MAG: DUF2846 domain-containing protein [Pyrinomonadaceae bacterium]
MKFLVNFTLVLTLACAASSFAQDQSPAPRPSTPPAPEQTSVAAEAPPAGQPVAPDSKATIYFYRIKQFTGSALEPSIYCDDKELARMDNGRYFGVKLEPGKHTCRMGDKQTGFEIDAKPGQDYYAKVNIETGFWKGRGRLTLVQNEQGAFEIKKTKPLGAGKIRDRSLVAIFEGSDRQQPTPKGN